jgi:hypothetical protein
LEDITKEWSIDLLVAADPTDMSDKESHEAMLDTPGPSRTKKYDEVEDVPAHPQRLLRSHLHREVMVTS